MEFAPKGTLCIILNNGNVEVHSQYDVEQTNDCKAKEVGVDKGYAEVFVDSDGESFGEGLGTLLTNESDYLVPVQKR